MSGTSTDRRPRGLTGLADDPVNAAMARVLDQLASEVDHGVRVAMERPSSVSRVKRLRDR